MTRRGGFRYPSPVKEEKRKEEKRIEASDIENARVRLGPLAGFEPRRWVPAAWGLGLALILFLVLLLPGFTRYGSYLVFEGRPSTAAIMVSGEYRGSTSSRLYLPAGTYTLNLQRFGFSPVELSVAVPGRRIASLIFPRVLKVSYTLEASNPEAALESALKEYAAWSRTGKSSGLYQIPSVLGETAQALTSVGSLEEALADLTPGPDSGGNTAQKVGFARLVASLTTQSGSARDGLRAAAFAAAGGPIGPLTVLAAARTLAAALGDSRQSSSLLAAAAPSATSLSAMDSPSAGNAPFSPLGLTSVAGQAFVLFPAGPDEGFGSVPAFGMATSEVTRRQWSAFLAENPAWRADRRDELIAAGFADSSYLAGWDGTADQKPVTGVSWYAARAYCEWLSKRSGAYRVILPSEAIWARSAAWARTDRASSARSVLKASGASGPEPVKDSSQSAFALYDMLGNVWEWTDDDYLPHPGLAAVNFQIAGLDKCVRGGSWANDASSVSLDSRGGVSPDHGSEFLGFRVAVIQR